MVGEEKAIEVMKQAAVAAGKVVMEKYKPGRNLAAAEKRHLGDVVTEVDIRSQETIRRILIEKLMAQGIAKEEVGFIGEENLNETGQYIFIIDPIDGTTNFAAGLGIFSISIGYAYGGDIKAGVVFDPISRSIYQAIKGQGAEVERNRVVQRLTMEYTEMKKSILSIHFNLEAIDELVEITSRIRPKVRGVRSLGSLVLDLCYLAEGATNALINGNGYIWDLAAAGLVVRESGGEIWDWQGKVWQPNFFFPEKAVKLIAGHPDNLAEILQYVKGAI